MKEPIIDIDPERDRGYPCPKCGHVMYIQAPEAPTPVRLAPGDEAEYTLREVCEILRISDRWARKLIKDGRLRATRLSEGKSIRWRVSQSALRDYRRAREGETK